jgi:hypothetical protein
MILVEVLPEGGFAEVKHRAMLPADNAYRVMVASDAVGMGLNLNIRRVIFHATSKPDGG